jgi:hypothetical protein
MPTTLEQSIPEDLNLEHLPTSETRVQSAPEYDEEGLEALVENAHSEVRHNETRIAETVDRRMSDTQGLERKKAAAILHGGGFSARIKSARERIADLSRRTQMMLAKRSEPQQESSQIKDTASNPLNLDEYARKYKQRGRESIRDKARLAQLKLKKIDNPERVLGFIHYIEEKAIGTDHETLWILDSELEKVKAEYKAKGYEVHVYDLDSSKSKGKTKMSITKDIPFHFDMKDARNMADLVESNTDPVEFFELLDSLGYKMTGYDFTLYHSRVKKFLDNPEIVPLLNKIRSSGGKIALSGTKYLFSGGEEGNNLLELAEQDAKTGLLDEKSLRGVAAISDILGYPIPSHSVESWKELADDPSIIELLKIAGGCIKGGFSPNNDSTLYGNLKYFKDSKVAGDVVLLVEQGFLPEQFFLNEINSYGADSRIAEIIPNVKELAKDTDLQKSLVELKNETGFSPKFLSNEFNKIRNLLTQNKQALNLIRIANEFAAGQIKWEIYEIENVIVDRKASEMIVQPDFHDLLSAITKAGYQPHFTDIFPGSRGYSKLYDVLNNEEFKAKIIRQENIDLAKHLKWFESSSWDASSFVSLMDHPNALENVKALEQIYGYVYQGGSIQENSVLSHLLSKQELITNLCKPETERIFKALREIGYSFNLSDFVSLTNLGSDEHLLAKLSDTDTVKFIQEVPHETNIAVLKSLANLEASCRPVVITIVKDFGYKITEDFSNDISRIEQFLDNPKLMDTARVLQQAGLPFHISDSEMLSIITKQDLIGTIVQYQEFPATRNFIIRNSRLINRESWDPSLHPLIETIAKEFQASSGGAESLQLLIKLRDNPQILQTAIKLKEFGLILSPYRNYDQLHIVAEQKLTDVLISCKDSPELQTFILNNLELIKSTGKEKLSHCLLERLKIGDSGSVRNNQMLYGELIRVLLNGNRYDILAEMAGDQLESTRESERIVEKFRKFADTYNISGKGQTILTLLSMRDYRQGEDFAGLLHRMEKSLDAYERLIENNSAYNIPSGLRASLGMEYEITSSTAVGYNESTSGNVLRTDMIRVSDFAGVGKGKDAIFEIATKPTDNPYLMLLEMQLLQELEFIDFNFRQPGYERGARGFHLTLSGEYGINVNSNSNFLQNSLMMSGWGGINAGEKVEFLSKARNMNIRPRATYDTKQLFDNVTTAVEFRSLSLDTWEPFERSVETSYLGAIAVQAVDKYLKGYNPLTFAEKSNEQFPQTPDGLVAMLRESGVAVSGLEDGKTKQIIYAWVKLQMGVYEALQDHNQWFFANETGGYFDDNEKWIDLDDFGGQSNAERFVGVAGGEQEMGKYIEQIKIKPAALFQPASPELANSCTAITNLFIKPSAESGGDVINAASSIETTKIGRTIEQSDPQAKYQSFFDLNGKTREGYYYLQGGSEKMLLHSVQIKLLEFNNTMKNIIA